MEPSGRPPLRPRRNAGGDGKVLLRAVRSASREAGCGGARRPAPALEVEQSKSSEGGFLKMGKNENPDVWKWRKIHAFR